MEHDEHEHDAYSVDATDIAMKPQDVCTNFEGCFHVEGCEVEREIMPSMLA